jgi:hypothetical protein
MPIVAPWLKAPDIAGEYLRGLALGQQSREASARLQEEQTRVGMEAQIRQQTLQQRALEDAQRIQVQKAYHDTEIGLRRQQLEQVQQAAAAKTRAAAIKLHQQATYSKVMQETNDPIKALFASGLATPERMIAARKDVEDLGAQRLDLRQRGLDLQQQRLADQEAAAAGKTVKPPVPRRIGERVVTDPVTGDRNTTYIFDTPQPPAVGTAPARGVKRLRWDSKSGGLVPVSEADEQ